MLLIIQVLTTTIYVLWQTAEISIFGVNMKHKIGQNSSTITTMFEHKNIAYM